MTDRTAPDIARTLFIDPTQTPSSDPRVDILAEMVLDLMMEIEALRRTHLPPGSDPDGREPDYPQAYRDTAYLTHNAAGPSGGFDKLLALFYPRESEATPNRIGKLRSWRECLMLRRLGFSPDQIEAYKADAQEAEMFT